MIALLEKNSLTVRTYFTAEKFQLTLNERQSTASVTLSPQAPTISVGDWIRDENDPGAGVVWRVKSVATDYGTDTRTLSCEHMVAALRDAILFGEISPATITGNKKSTKCTAKQAAQYILGKTGIWTLGSFGFDKTAPYNFNGEDLFSALETVSSSLAGAWWEYDFSKYPFKLSIVKASTGVACEMRMDRNITSLKKTIDMSRMFTRFYPVGKNDLRLSGDGYVSKNESVYGRKDKTETDQEKDTQQKLKDWAEERLRNHAEPAVTVTVSGLDLSDLTGESLDWIRLGTVCRVPLPEFGTVMEERVTTLSWSDKIADPESVTVTLANQVEDVATIVNRLAKSSGASGRSAAKKAGEDHAWFVDTEDHVGMVAEALAGEGASKNWSRVSSLIVSGSGIAGTVKRVDDDINGENGIESRIRQNESSIDMVVGVNKKGKFIKAGQICLAINNDGSSVATINANRIHLLGKTIADKINAAYLSAKIASLANVNVQKLTSERGGISVHSVSTTAFVQGGVGCYVPHAVKDLQIVKNGTTVTLQRKWFSEDSWTDVGSFSRATALSGAWSGGKITVSANADNVPDLIQEIRAGNTTWNGKKVTIMIDAYTEQGIRIGETGREVEATYTLQPTAITLTRQKKTTEPTTDGTLSAITSNGWYQLDVTAAGVTKTWKVRVNVT